MRRRGVRAVSSSINVARLVGAATASESNLRARRRHNASRASRRARVDPRAMSDDALEDALRRAAPRGRAVAHFGVGNELLVCNLDDGARAEAPRACAWGRATASGARVAASTSAALLTLRKREVRAESDERRRCAAMRFVSPEGDLVFKRETRDARRETRESGRR